MYKSVLINKENSINEKILKKISLIEILNINKEKTLIEKKTYEAYLELADFFKTKDIILGIDSAYRSIEQQLQIYNEFVDQYNKEYANEIVAPGGKSEHHTGLAIDLNILINGNWQKNNKELLKLEAEFSEISKYLHKFGFILRYPKGKEKITGYPYEPWHIRYVGKVIAKVIHDNTWTLEEYKEKFNGIIAINKKQGMTSFDVVREISHIFGLKKVGHTGTLDPLAEGVLLVAIGKATKIVELLTAEDKEYIATAKLGLKTDTYDITGKVLNTKPLPIDKNLQKVFDSFQKTYLQEVPIYSAIKVKGKKLYDYARDNQEVELPKKQVKIKEIELLNSTTETFKFRTLVSKGTYIRSLINDIGESMDTYATMTSLIRTKQGNVDIENTFTIEDVKNNNYKIYNVDEILNFPIETVDKNLEFKISNGQKIDNIWKVTDKIIFKNTDNKLLGIYDLEGQKLKVWKNFN